MVQDGSDTNSSTRQHAKDIGPGGACLRGRWRRPTARVGEGVPDLELATWGGGGHESHRGWGLGDLGFAGVGIGLGWAVLNVWTEVLVWGYMQEFPTKIYLG